MTQQSGAAIGAFAGAACLIGSVVVGVMLMQATGGDAASTALAGQPQLLTVAELLKFGSAIAGFIVVGALTGRLTAKGIKPASIMALIGYLGSLLLAASGGIGLAALYTDILEPATGATLANQAGLASAAATGLWAGLCGLFGWKSALPKWLCVVGVLLAVVSLAMVAVPPVGLLTALTGLIWLVGLGLLFLKKAVA